jgi:plastocyanin
MKATKVILALALLAAAPLARAEGESADAPAGFAGCTDAAFVTIAGQQQITTAGHTYAPKCLRVKVGTAVTIAGSNVHPLQGVGADNPIFSAAGPSTSAKTVTFTKPGVYGFYCENHGDEQGNGMAGAILAE